MCTAITYKTKDHYFGRNFDLEYSYFETVTIVPRNFIFNFSKEKAIKKHYALIGMAYVNNNYPLFYDATNEKGLSMAGLNFPNSAFYKPIDKKKKNIAPFELIPWVLATCATVDEALSLLKNTNIAAIDFSEELKATPLHWIIADKEKSIVVEPLEEGMKIFENPVGVLTNNPRFDIQMHNLSNYMYLSIEPIKNNFSKSLDLKEYSRGMGGLGLPGDLSSASRFVKATFVKMNSLSNDSEEESVSQFFHILKSVEQQRGCVKLEKGYEITIYSSCCNADKGIYYYTTYDNNRITGVDMNRENLDGNSLVIYNLDKKQEIKIQN